jgi:hypothetical protein
MFNQFSGVEFLSDIGLVSTFEPLKRTVSVTLHSLDVFCSKSTANVIVDLDLQLDRCRFFAASHFSSVKELASVCQRMSNERCFLWKDSLCFCNSSTFGQFVCLSYDQRATSCSHCYNRGHCIGTDLKNRVDFKCICPQCTSGELSISMEYLIEKTRWGVGHFVIPGLFLLVALILNGLCFVTFFLPQFRRTGTGLYLLITSLINQVIFVDLFLHILYLHLFARFVLLPNANEMLCKALPYLLSVL